ncbi:hypothetical protein [Fibrella aquatilis]|uniref:Uncharacterized protein n=1 Tax=Fibrella aquatilis TaxID=2817059 RepID=A0A939G9P0_9BACT|nr:hypothetical protein [Fibrella aquatilis]MBO0933224.1 hypothetical protein [Fibrella aquatilis]
MKFLSSLLLLLSLAVTSYGQNQIDLTLRYNIGQSRYEVYARPNFSQTDFLWGSSQISVVTPASVSNAPFVISNLEAGGWDDSSPLYAPSAAPSLDFHGIGSPGKKITLVAGQEKLLFTFTLPGNACVAGLRLFVNGSDPGSNSTTMPGDFANVVYAAGNANSFYRANYANTGSTCTACNLVAPSLSK